MNQQPNETLEATVTKEETGSKRLPLIPVSRAGAQLATMADMWTMAVAICSAGMQPMATKTDRMNPSQVMVAIQMGAEVGLPPMTALKNVAIIKGRPTIWGDALLALAYRSNLVESISETIEGEGDKRVAVCRTKRRGVEGETVRTFSVADAKTAGLWGSVGPWTNYPDRMLAMRARGFALRDAYPDQLGGFMLAEEAQDLRVDEGGVETSRSEALLAELTKSTPRLAEGGETPVAARRTTEVPEPLFPQS